jgi:hypothetical protein
MNIAATPTLSADDEATRNAYNTAFSEMEIGWHWDADTYRELLADGGQPVRSFVERHRRTAARLRDRLPGQRGRDHAPGFERTEVSVVSRNAPAGPRAARERREKLTAVKGFGRIRRAYSGHE